MFTHAQSHRSHAAASTAVPVACDLPTATLAETMAVLADVITPTLAKGVIIRRPSVLGVADRMQWDRRAIRRMQQLRDKYHDGPLMMRLPIRSHALILSPAHVHRVLDNSPEPFATATAEKRAALAHFEPKQALISHGPKRADRRRFNEEVLQSGNPMHDVAASFIETVRQEAEGLVKRIRPWDVLAWKDFSQAWFRIVRLVTFGEPAREDHELSSIMARLRERANWAFLAPQHRQLRDQLHRRIDSLLAQAAPGSLAHRIAQTRTTDVTAPSHQVPQWLFAFDPAGMTTYRALALLASHPEHAARAREEIQTDPDSVAPLPYLRATMLETLRLWPTTPLVLRETTRDVQWETGVMPKNTNILIFAPFFHRDDRRLEYADRFTPDLWLHDEVAPGFSGSPSQWPLIPFSSGPAICPARNLVLLLGSHMLASLIGKHRFELIPQDRLNRYHPLPATLDHFSLRFRMLGRIGEAARLAPWR